MKYILIIILTTIVVNASAYTVFSDPNPGSSHYRAVYYPGSTDFAVSRATVSKDSRTCGRYILSSSVLPTDSRARWGGGYSKLLQSSNLPWYWELEFDLHSATNEVIKIEIEVRRVDIGTAPYPVDIFTYWVEHSGNGWEPFYITSNQPHIYSTDTTYFSSPRTYIRVGKESHDTLENPLSISEVGTHTFFIDDIIMTGTDTPIISAPSMTNNTMLVDFIGTIQSSTNLIDWTTITPQPASPYEIAPQANQLFFRTIKE